MAQLPGPAALVHEWFTPRSVGGSELVVQQLDALLGQPQLAALVDGESRRSASWLAGRSILTSFVQRLPWGVSHVQQYLPLLPLAIEQLDLSAFPLVVSSSHLVAKGVLTSPDQCHLSYVHTPVRYAWDQMHAYLQQSALARRGLSPLIRWQLHNLRQWDVLSAQRPDALIANSRFTAARIRRYWGRRASVIHPPVDLQRFHWDHPRDDVYLCLCRLVPYKRVDLVVEAFNVTGLPLVVIGDGPERQRLQAIAGPNVRLLGHLSSPEVNAWLARCRAYVYAGLEDFGIAPVEAMASGAPVIGLGQGGLLDSVRCITSGCDQPTGLLFPQQSRASLVAALEHFEQQRLWTQLPAPSLRGWAEAFGPQRFRQRMAALIDQVWSRHQRKLAGRGRPVSVPLG